jgi:hypothetical protein
MTRAVEKSLNLDGEKRDVECCRLTTTATVLLLNNFFLPQEADCNNKAKRYAAATTRKGELGLCKTRISDGESDLSLASTLRSEVRDVMHNQSGNYKKWMVAVSAGCRRRNESFNY